MLKVGELAALANLTVRTLHHYDSIGLLRPSARSDAGYRLYDRSTTATTWPACTASRPCARSA
jgi:DNA-binding transcriptional MerR regulator